MVNSRGIHPNQNINNPDLRLNILSGNLFNKAKFISISFAIACPMLLTAS